MLKIQLTQNRAAYIDNNMAHLRRWKWYAVKHGKSWYAGTKIRRENGQRGTVYLHWAVKGKPINGLVVDHINGDGLFNVESNLRHVTYRENSCNQNRKREGKTSSKYTGVYLHRTTVKNKTYKKWKAQIRIGNAIKSLGYFNDEREASKAYQVALKNIIS